MKKSILNIALLLLIFCSISAQEDYNSPQRKTTSPLTIVKSVYPSTSKLVKINAIWNKAVDKKGKILGYVFNSTEYGKGISGFGGPVPTLVVTDKSQKIKKVAIIKSSETQQYLQKVTSSNFLKKWNGKTIQQAKEVKVDGVTGATFSSRAIIKNVQLISKKATETKLKK
jgi:Na+-translocating ferredoxin:NAD+ oxidoreductase RnfG subunit